MPKKNKARKNQNQSRENIAVHCKQENQDYGLVVKKLGDRRVTCSLPDGTEILALIPGKFRKKVWIDLQNVVLISYRDFQKDRVDIIYRYSPREVKQLYKKNEISKHFFDGNEQDDEGENIEFNSDDEDDKNDKEIDFDSL
jgi:translation initiation factor 1A